MPRSSTCRPPRGRVMRALSRSSRCCCGLSKPCSPMRSRSPASCAFSRRRWSGVTSAAFSTSIPRCCLPTVGCTRTGACWPRATPSTAPAYTSSPPSSTQDLSCCNRRWPCFPMTPRPRWRHACSPASTSSIRASSAGSRRGVSASARGRRGSMASDSRPRLWRIFVPQLSAEVRRVRWPVAVVAAVLVVSTRTAHADELRPYTATYNGIWKGMTVAVSTLKLEQTGDTWTFSSRSEPRGIGKLASGVFPPLQVSVVRVTDQGVQPQSFKSSGGDSGKSIELKYDWQAHRVTGIYESTKVDLPLTPRVQDDGSVQLALMVELLAGRTPPTLQLIDKNSVREYEFSRDGEATIKTPLGDVKTEVFKSQKKYSPRVTRFWCAPDRGYIPMRVQQKKDDDVQWTMEIQSLKR